MKQRPVLYLFSPTISSKRNEFTFRALPDSSSSAKNARNACRYKQTVCPHSAFNYITNEITYPWSLAINVMN